MRISRVIGIAAALTAGFAQAQDVKVNILTEFWYTQMMSNNLRLDSAAKAGAAAYYDGMSSGRFAENGFTLKRAEVYCNYKISDEWAGYIMFDPNNATNSVPNNVLQDFVITYAPKDTGFTVKAGQFKMPTVYESTILSARDIYFFDRTQLARQFAEKRDRGVWFAHGYGKADAFKGNVNFAISNGSTDDGSSGKTAVDANAQKDYTFRFDGSYGKHHRFGFYYREGEYSLKDGNTTLYPGQVNSAAKGAAPVLALPANWTAAGVTAANVLANKDKTTLEGFFYAFDADFLHVDFEYATGLLGRRNPTIFSSTGTWAFVAKDLLTEFTPSAMGREYLDQKFTGYALTAVYKMGAHQIAARYDMLNYNSGDNWYGNNPYMVATGDYSPKYTETTVGYNYVFNPTKYTYGKLKVDYILRSKNFLTPRAGQTGAQGGDSMVASIMVGF